MNIHLVSLGCARNQIDSEMMEGLLENAGHKMIEDPYEAEAIVVNTCSFIEPAAQESVDVILELATLKQEGRCRRLIVAGCLPERFREAVAEQLPEVDFFLGTGAYDKIVEAIEITGVGNNNCLLPSPAHRPFRPQDARRKPTLPHSAYLKVAEGCSRSCTYCIIPKLRGPHRSRPLEDIVQEAENLIRGGAKEINLVAQDTTSWGCDFSPPKHPSDMLEALSRTKSNTWIRMLYGHPDKMDTRLIRTIGQTPGICPYFDIPIQHASTPILKKMGRNYQRADLIRLFKTIRDTVPDAVLRTTIIVGFPGETEKDVDELIDFIHEIRFDHLGVFIYSDEDDLASHRLKNHVSPSKAKKRYNRIMKEQLSISEKSNERYLGKHLDVLVEEAPEDGIFTGRTWFQAPEVDGITYIRCEDGVFSNEIECGIGRMVRVKIIDSMEYDLIGEPL